MWKIILYNSEIAVAKIAKNAIIFEKSCGKRNFVQYRIRELYLRFLLKILQKIIIIGVYIYTF